MLVTVCLILGVASKAMLVTVPGVMLLIALWRDGRLPSVRTVAPEVTIAGIVSVILIRAQHGSSVHSGAPFLQRLSNAVVGIKEYLELTVWPDALSVFHPARIDGRTPHEVVVAVALLGGITGLSIFAWRRDARAPLVGWIWFLGMLIPVSGIIPIGAHAIAERYTYLPHVGLFVAVVFGLDEIWPHGRRICAAAVAIALTLFFVRTITVVETWESNTTLSAAGLRAEPSNPVLLPVYGAGLLRAGAWGPAIERMEHAMAARRIFWSPAGSETPATQLGITLLEVPGRLDTAIHWLRKAVESNPRNCLARRGLSVGLARQGDLDGAIDEARLAVAVGKPVDDRDNHRNLASLLMGAGRAREALELLRAAPHSIQSDVADFRLRAAALTTNCAGAVSEGDALASALYRPTTAFIDGYLLALACVGDIRAVSVLETAPPSQSRARLIAELIVTLRANEPLPAETLAVLISNAPPLHGLENDRLAPMAMRPTDLASVLKLIDPSGRH